MSNNIQLSWSSPSLRAQIVDAAVNIGAREKRIWVLPSQCQTLTTLRSSQTSNPSAFRVLGSIDLSELLERFYCGEILGHRALVPANKVLTFSHGAFASNLQKLLSELS